MTKKKRKCRPAKRVQYHVVFDKRAGLWCINRNGRRWDSFPIKFLAAQIARRMAKGEDRASLRIHKKNGRIQSEATYPRLSDPYPPKG